MRERLNKSLMVTGISAVAACAIACTSSQSGSGEGSPMSSRTAERLAQCVKLTFVQNARTGLAVVTLQGRSTVPANYELVAKIKTDGAKPVVKSIMLERADSTPNDIVRRSVPVPISQAAVADVAGVVEPTVYHGQPYAVPAACHVVVGLTPS